MKRIKIDINNDILEVDVSGIISEEIEEGYYEDIDNYDRDNKTLEQYINHEKFIGEHIYTVYFYYSEDTYLKIYNTEESFQFETTPSYLLEIYDNDLECYIFYKIHATEANKIVKHYGIYAGEYK